ncbi:MAG TPA: O-antigen ligase family protein [Thermoanaerobaculia bacterium]|nr:O-antigen ligase family protein [Thermoanaerobaculia bacterium]
MTLSDSFRRLLDAPAPLRVAVFAYLAHLLCQGWIGSSETFLGIALIGIGLAWKRRGLSVPFHPLYLPLALFAVGSILSAAFSDRPLISLANANEWFAFLAFPLALALYARFPTLPRLAITMLLVLGSLQSLYGLVQFFAFGHDALERRIMGTTAHVMTYSGILLPLCLMFIALALGRERRAWFALGAALTSLAIVLTFTRGAWLGWMTGLAVLFLMRRPRFLLYLAPILLLAITFSPLPLFARLVSSFDFQQTSVLDRIRMTQAGVEMIRDHPLLGVGPSNVKEVYPLYRQPDAPRFRIPHLHNNPVQIWAERGLLPFVAWALLQIMFLRDALSRRGDPRARDWAEGGIAATCGLLVAGLFEYNFGDTEVLLTTLAVWALTLAGPGGDATPVAGSERRSEALPRAGESPA